MSSGTSTREAIELRILEASRLMPDSRPADLPPTAIIPDVPAWHDYEHQLWRLGEEVHQLFGKQPNLRKDESLYSSIFGIVAHRAGMRGRQSWVWHFGCKQCSNWASKIAGLLPDPDIDGHVISALYKMKAPRFSGKILPYRESRKTWVRKEAVRYLAWDATT
jgi:hypothetical protein